MKFEEIKYNQRKSILPPGVGKESTQNQRENESMVWDESVNEIVEIGAREDFHVGAKPKVLSHRQRLLSYIQYRHSLSFIGLIPGQIARPVVETEL